MMIPKPKTVIIGSRPSQLARIQATIVLEFLRSAHPNIEFVHKTIMTAGDKDRRSRMEEVSSGSGAFIKALEMALYQNEIDVAIHSLKDLPTEVPQGLTLAAVPPRESPYDAICGNRLANLPHGAKVGTGSPRRSAQILRVRPDLTIVPVRGNVPPRLHHLRESSLSAIILAHAGLRRLNLDDSIAELLPLDDFVPSAGQGALGVETRDESEITELVSAIIHPPDMIAALAERTFLKTVGGGCSVPVGVYASVNEETISLSAQIISLDGNDWVGESRSGPVVHATQMALDMAHDLLERGGARILQAISSPVAI